MRSSVLIALVVGCSFSPHGAQGDGGMKDAMIDATGSGSDPGSGSNPGSGSGSGSNQPQSAVLHLGSADATTGTGDLTLSGGVMIDTSAYTIGTNLPTGVTFTKAMQLNQASFVAVLHVRKLDISIGAMVQVVGDKPLIIVAGGVVMIEGTIDAGAQGSIGGPGSTTTGTGTAGAHTATGETDSGGGGGSYGGTGAIGGSVVSGSCMTAGGAAGASYGDGPISVLVGGSPGGASSGGTCAPDTGGGGGGALQITSFVSIQNSGSIFAGGGGGTGGNDCGQPDGNSGAGGGAGGAIVLQAPAIANSGYVIADGAGGGGGATGDDQSGDPGFDADGSDVAFGGDGDPDFGTNGGNGARDMTAAMTGTTGSTCGDNAGGGGGGVGRIAVSAGYADAAYTFPPPIETLPP